MRKDNETIEKGCWCRHRFKRLLTAFVWILAILVLMVGTSCERRAMYDNEGGRVYIAIQIDIDIDIDIDVDVDVDADVNRSEPQIPETFVVGFYNPDTHQLVTTQYVSSKGGFVEIAPGNYDIVAYNFNAEFTQVRNSNRLYDIEALTSQVTGDISSKFSRVTENIARNRSPRATRDYDSQIIVNEPDHLYAGMVENFNIPISVAEYDVVHINMVLSTILERYTIKVSKVHNGQYLFSAESFISGMASAKMVVERTISDGPCAIWFPLKMYTEQECLYTSFYSFGRFEPTDANYVLLHLVDVTGKVYDREYDVSDQLRGGGHRIEIEDDIDIKPNSGGFNTDVEIWDETFTDIII